MLSRRLVAGSMLGLAFAICLPRASGQDTKPATKPQNGGGVPFVIEVDVNGVLGRILAGGGEKKDAKPTEKTEKAEALKALEELMKKHPAFGGKVVFQIEAAGADPKSAPGAAAKLEKALKQLSGPVDQLDLREVRKLVAEALGEMKKGQPITSNRMLSQGGLKLIPGMGQGWGGPGSSPWMPGAPAAQGPGRIEIVPDGELEKKIKIMIRGEAEKREEVERSMAPGREKDQAMKQLEEARRRLEEMVKEAREKAGGPVQARWSVVPAEAEEHLTLTRRVGRYVARMIDHGVRITVTGSTGNPAGGDVILIESGEDVSSYGDVNAVPMRYRPQVARLLDIAKR